jgi:hypothetical protein
VKAHLRLLILTITVISFGFSARAQTTGPTLDEAIEGYENATGEKLEGIPIDWSDQHVIFSAPTSSVSQEKIEKDPRYWLQQIRRLQWQASLSAMRTLKGQPSSRRTSTMSVNVSRAPTINSTRANVETEKNASFLAPALNLTVAASNPTGEAGNKDWAVSLGGAGSTVGAGQCPAAYLAVDTPDCTNDFVVYNTGAAGAVAVAASGTGTFTGQPTSGQTATVNGHAFTASSISNTGTNFQIGTSTTVTAGNLVSAINRTAATNTIVTAANSAAVVTITAKTSGTGGNSITLAKTLSNFSWSGSTLAGGINAQATIVAFNNLYSGTCSGSVPEFAWAYNTGTGAVAKTSTGTSADGTQVAFVQTSAAGVATLVLLKWANNNALSSTNPLALTSQASASAYRSCSAPCMYTIAFNGGHDDTRSAPFYDFSGTDTLYVGDNNGLVHQFTGVFSGDPAETVSATNPIWPVNVGSATVLTGPTFNNADLNIYVGGANGILYDVNPTVSPTTITASQAIGSGTGIVDGPLLDPTAGTGGTLYAFVADDGSTNCGSSQPCSAVFQFQSEYSSGNPGAETTTGIGSSTIPVHGGTFDNIYFNSSNATGNLYTCAQPGSTSTIYQIPITANTVPGAANVGVAVSTTGPGPVCSPMTEVFNGTTDLIFGGISTSGVSVTGCTGGACVYNFDVTSGTTPLSIGYGLTSTSGSSAIVIDNTSSDAGASNVYFTTLGNQSCVTSGGSAGGCAIQASQSTLSE